MANSSEEKAEQQVRIFISSPSDVEAERIKSGAILAEIAAEFSHRFKIVPIRWEESYYSAHKTFQAAIPTPSSCDLVVCILWRRLGSELPPAFDRHDGTTRTGTEYEFEEALEAALEHETPDILVYRKKSKILFDAERVEQEHAELRALNAFWQKWFRDEQGHFTAGFDSFDTVDEFGDKLKKHLRQWILHRGEVITWPIELKGSPFRGLEAFNSEHAEVFFGRRRAVRHVVARLQACAARGCAFLVVLGMSGAGKSSLVRAGVLPWLMQHRGVPEVDEWRSCVIRPGTLSDNPLLGLCRALFAPGALPELAQGDHNTPLSLAALALKMPEAAGGAAITGALSRAAEAARRRDKLDRPVTARLALVVDQLEELLSLTTESRDALLGMIDALARSGQVWVIATLRSDLYAELQANPLVLKLKESGGTYDLLPPGGPEMREIIEGPARASGLVLEQHNERGLSELLEKAALQPGALPLLEFTLQSLFERRDTASKTLLLSVYDELGGLEGAIAREAERLVASLPPPLQAALPALLLALVDMDEAHETATARTLARSQLTDQQQIALADLLLQHRFLVADNNGAGATLRLAHEALLAHWPRLTELIKNHADFLAVRRRLQREEAAWRLRNRSADFLLPAGRRLAEAQEMLELHRADLDSGAIAYIEASVEAERARAAAERQREEASLRRDLEAARRLMRRTRAAAIVTLALLAVVAGFAGLWLSQRGVARERQAEAEHNYGLALEGATKNIALVEREHDLGDVSTAVTQSLLNSSRETFSGLSGTSDSPAAALAQLRLFDALATSYLAIGNLDSALESARAESSLAAQLAEKQSGDNDWQHALAVGHERIGDVLREQRNLAGALTEYRAELAIATRLVSNDPANADWQRNLSDAHAKVGAVLDEQGDSEGAVKEFQAQLAIATALAAHDPTGARDLAISHERLGDALQRQGDFAAALREHRAQLTIMADLASKTPDSATAQRDLAIAHENLGDDLLAQKNPEAALDEYKAAIPILVQLAAKDASNNARQRDLSIAHEKLGDAFREQKDLANALKEYRADLDISAQLVAKDPTNSGWQEDLSISHQNVGEILRAQGDVAGALAEYRANLSIVTTLASNRDASWQQRLALAHEQVGELLQKQGNLAAALQEYRAELAITAQLAAADRNNAAAQRDLAISHAKVGDVLRSQQDNTNALGEFRQCLGITAPTVGSGAEPLQDIHNYCQQRIAQSQ
jgi:tetratricopeptide (TPR) repeat protein